MGSLFLGFESDLDSSHLARSNHLAALRRGRARAFVAVGFPSSGPRLRIASPIRSRAGRWIKIERSPRRLLPPLSLAHERTVAMAGERVVRSALSHPASSQRLPAFNAAWVAHKVLLHLLRPPRVAVAAGLTRARLGSSRAALTLPRLLKCPSLLSFLPLAPPQL